MIKLARPLAMRSSAKVRQPLPTLRIRMPLRPALHRSLPRGKRAPRARAPAIMIEPERMKRVEMSTYGGKVSRLMRMPRYVVPQKKQTASSAR